MTIQEDAKAKAKTQTMSAMEERTAVYLKKSWSLVQIGARKLGLELPNDPTATLPFPAGADEEANQKLRDAEWLRLGKQLIDEQKITVAGAARDLYIDELDTVMDEQMKQSLNVSSFKMLIPTRNQVTAISETVATSVERATGSGIGFLDNALGGASLGDMFRGLFTWIFSGFDGGFDGLKQTIAGYSGGRMRDNAVKDLTQLRKNALGTTEDISGFMKPEIIGIFGEEIAKAPALSLKTQAENNPLAMIRATEIGGIDTEVRWLVEGDIRTKLFNAIGTGFKENTQFKGLYDSKEDGLFTTVGAYVSSAREVVGFPSEQTTQRNALDKIQFEVSARLAKIVVDPEYTYQGTDPNLASLKGKPLRDMVPESQALVMADEARQTIRGLSATAPNPDFYMLLSETLPATLATEITAREKSDDIKVKIPWSIAGLISDQLVSANKSALKKDEKAAAQAAKALADELQKQISEQLGTDAKPTPEGEKLNKLAGAKLQAKHIHALAEAISPTMLPMLTDSGKKEIKESGQGIYEESASRFRKALREHANNINIDGVKLSPQALDVIADKMALSYVDKELFEKPAKDDPFLKTMKDRENAAAQVAIVTQLKPMLESKQTQLNALIDPAKKQPKMTPENRDALAEQLGAAIVPFAQQVDFFKDISIPALYTKAHTDLSQALVVQLRPANNIGLSDKAIKALADSVAVEYITKEGKVSPPKDVLDIVRASQKDVAAEVIEKTLTQQLSDKDSYHNVTLANEGKEVKIEIAVSAVKTLMAERLVDTDSFSKLSDTDYSNFYRELRKTLESKRADMGITPTQEGTALLDVMAYQMTTGIVTKTASTVPAIPEEIKKIHSAAESLLAEMVIPKQVRALLLPKIKGTVSADSDTLDPNNVTIANVLAMDASQSGLHINAERLIHNVSDVITYQKIRATTTGIPVDEEQMRKQLIGAMSGESVGLGQASIQQLSALIAKEGKRLIDNTGAPPENVDNAALAREILTKFSATVQTQVEHELANNPSTKDGLNNTDRAFIAQSAANALTDIASGKVGIPMSYNKPKETRPFIQSPHRANHKAIETHVQSTLLTVLQNQYGWSLSNWKEDVSKGVSTALSNTIIPQYPDRKKEQDQRAELIQRKNPWGILYLNSAKHLPLAQSQHNVADTQAGLIAFAEVQKALPKLRPSEQTMEAAMAQFEQAFGNDSKVSKSLLNDSFYKEALKDYLQSEAKFVVLTKLGIRGDEANTALTELNQKHHQVMRLRSSHTYAIVASAQEKMDKIKDHKQILQNNLVWGELAPHTPLTHEKADKDFHAMLQRIENQREIYEKDVQALHDKEGATYQDAKRQLEQPAKAQNLADLQQRNNQQALIESYYTRMSALDEQQATETAKMYEKLKELYLKLPHDNKIAEGKKLLAVLKKQEMAAVQRDYNQPPAAKPLVQSAPLPETKDPVPLLSLNQILNMGTLDWLTSMVPATNRRPSSPETAGPLPGITTAKNPKNVDKEQTRK